MYALSATKIYTVKSIWWLYIPVLMSCRIVNTLFGIFTVTFISGFCSCHISSAAVLFFVTFSHPWYDGFVNIIWELSVFISGKKNGNRLDDLLDKAWIEFI